MIMDLCGVSVSSPPSKYKLHLFNDSLNDSVGSNSNIADETNDSLSDTRWNQRQAYPGLLLMAHLNINSVQNTFDELKLIDDKLRAGILVLTETKIDATYLRYQTIDFIAKIESRAEEKSWLMSPPWSLLGGLN